MLDKEEDEMIYVPYLYINYKERVTGNIEDLSLPLQKKKGPLTTVEFSTEYSSETPGFTEFAVVIFWIILSVMILMWFYYIYRACQR
jgi:RsiW-degrading membrane proteinase PrsW (M82 family)